MKAKTMHRIGWLHSLLFCLCVAIGFLGCADRNTQFDNTAWRYAFLDSSVPSDVKIERGLVWQGSSCRIHRECFFQLKVTDAYLSTFKTQRSCELISVKDEQGDILWNTHNARPAWFPLPPYSGYNVWRCKDWPVNGKIEDAQSGSNRIGYLFVNTTTKACFAYVLKDDWSGVRTNIVWSSTNAPIVYWECVYNKESGEIVGAKNISSNAVIDL